MYHRIDHGHIMHHGWKAGHGGAGHLHGWHALSFWMASERQVKGHEEAPTKCWGPESPYSSSDGYFYCTLLIQIYVKETVYCDLI